MSSSCFTKRCVHDWFAAVTDVGLSVHFIETKATFATDRTVFMADERIGRNLYHLNFSKDY